MADSTTILDTIQQSQAQKEVTANALYDAMSPGALYGRRASTTSGLTWGYYGGTFQASPTARVLIANGTVALTASATNYVEADLSTGVVTKNTTAFTSSGNIPLYKIVTGGTTVTSYEDWRTKGGASGGGGSTSPLTTKGDIYTRSSSADARLAVGSDGQVLTADAASTNGVKWAFAPATLNRVDGGDFTTNAWACGTPAACSSSASVSLDGRWTVSTTSAATFNIIKVADVPTFDNSGYGATHSLQVDCTAGDATVAATDYTVITHTIPVAAMKDLGAGGGSAGRYVTVSFWVRSLQTGT
jgi:hypothetical protein